MKNKLTPSLLSLLLLNALLNAAVVDLPKSQQVAKNVYFERSYQTDQNIRFESIAIAKTWIERENQEPVFYIFNMENDGFVIISAEDLMPPVLGYSLTGSCSNMGVDPNFDSFMENYISQILLVREQNPFAEPMITGQWSKYSTNDPKTLMILNDNRGVAPLLTCLWNQDNPYNMLCPEDPMGPGGHVYAGCVATAMSMVMYYWRYPMQGIGSNSYYYPPYGNISANFGATQYVWNQMKDVMDPNYNDVALIQFHCGVAVEMMYSPSGSGAYSWDVPGAIKNNFGYNNNAQFKEKDNYTMTQWVNLLKTQIDLSQPMYYSGFSNAGGHAFGCDGYDDNDYFHFNFGWSGTSNGYYTLYSVGGFSDGQGAVINFIPGNGYPYYYTGLQTLTAKSGTFEDGSGPKENYMPDTDVSWLIDPQTENDSVSSITLKFSRFDISVDDQVVVYDGETTTASVLAVLTGNSIPAQITSSGNKMLVVFTSNNQDHANGFLASYSTEAPVWCSGLTEYTEPTAELSDGSGRFDYYNGSVCLWRILPENATSVTLYFTSFDTEEDVDVVKIFDLGAQELLAEYSGTYDENNLPPPVTSPSGKMFIAFSSNDAISGAGWEGYYVTGTVGVGNEQEDDAISIFPNPCNDVLNITGLSEPAQVRIYNSNGKMVYSNDQFTNSGIDTGNLMKGLYFVNVITSDKSLTYKQVIE